MGNNLGAAIQSSTIPTLQVYNSHIRLKACTIACIAFLGMGSIGYLQGVKSSLRPFLVGVTAIASVILLSLCCIGCACYGWLRLLWLYLLWLLWLCCVGCVVVCNKEY